jgi:uncharacterized GH25 family protein
MNIRRLSPAVVTLCLLASLATQPASAAVQETTIKIVVKNEFDKPVPNAAVILDFLGSRQVLKLGMHKKTHWEVHTNQEGFAHFPPVPEGSVQLQIINSKYQTYGQKMDIQGPEKLVEVTLHPPQSQYSAHPALKPADPPKQ